MKTMSAAFATALVIAVVAQYGLQNAGFSSDGQQSSDYVRLE